MSETYTPNTQQETSDQEDSPERTRLGSRLARKVLDIVENRRVLAYRAELDHLAAPERDLDHLITDDQEILGESGGLGKNIRAGAKDTMNAVDKMYVKARNHNPTAKLRDSYLAYRRDRLTRKVEELEQKLAASPDTFINKRRQARLEVLKNRRDWKKGILEKRTKKYATRAEKLNTRIENRAEKFQKQVDQYIAEKVEAMRRQEQRKLLKDQGFGRLSRILSPFERAKFIANLPEDTKKRLTREAILAVRKANIKKGKLDWMYPVDEEKDTRKIGRYERTTE